MGYFTYWTSDTPKRVVTNTIASEGHLEALDALLNGTGGVGELYIGLIDYAIGIPTAFQTLADKDWNEFTNYREAYRQVWNRDTVVDQTVNNLERTPSVFTVAADIELQGFFLTDSPNKGDTVGKLLAISDSFAEQFNQHDRIFLQYTWEF